MTMMKKKRRRGDGRGVKTVVVVEPEVGEEGVGIVKVFHLKELSDHGKGPRHLIKVVMVAIREVEGAIKRKGELGETLVKVVELGLGQRPCEECG